jgi:hypothetical protein
MSEHEGAESAAESYIVFSRPVLEALDEAGVDLEDILEKASNRVSPEVAGAVRLVPDPAVASGTRALDPVTIVATAALIAALTPAVVRIVEAVVRGRTVIHERELAPVVDAKGEPVLGPNGQQVITWRERERRGGGDAGASIGFRIRAFGIEIDLSR